MLIRPLPCRLLDPADCLAAALAGWEDLAPGTPLSVILPASGLAAAMPAGAVPDLWFWARPETGRSRLACGTARVLEASGPQRLAQLAERWAELRRGWRVLDPAATGAVPCGFLGLGFDAAATARLTLPELALETGPHGSSACFSAIADGRSAGAVLRDWLQAHERLTQALAQPQPPAEPPALRRLGADPEDTAWLHRTAAAVADIRSGRLDKLVLTRIVRVAADRAIDCSRVTRRLAERHSGCAILAVGRDDGVLLAATPERLAAVSGGRVASDALAGTAPHDGSDLAGNAKERHEHRLVVDWIVAGLGEVCTALSLPDEPQVMRLPRLRHLWTPVRGRLRPARGLLDVVARLHPTPAVAGLPLTSALGWLAEHGDTRADWYTGAAGWLDLAGDGEVHVVLRAALVRGAAADLYAGAGIVAQSDPAAELAETAWKLRTMLEALEDG